jgi:4-amino-4-deoxy-L-arabinose transferase-like glycosyltransferase
MYILFTPFALLILMLEDTQFKKAFWHYCLVIFFAALVIAPWSIKISLQDQSLSLLSTNGPDALAGGLNSKLVEGYRIVEAPNGRLTIVGPGMWTHEHGYLTPEENSLPPKERNEILLERLTDWMKEHPSQVVYLEFAKLINLWGFYPMYWSLKERIFFVNIPTLIILSLGLIAIWKWRYQYRELCRFWAIPIFLSCVALVSLGSWRYRLPADVALIILSSMLIISLNDKKENKFINSNPT